MTTTLKQAEEGLVRMGYDPKRVTLGEDVSPLDRWTFALEYEFDNGRGVEWAANMVRDDGLEVYVENRGRGGCNIYSGLQGAREALSDDAATVLTGSFESEDTFCLLVEAVRNPSLV